MAANSSSRGIRVFGKRFTNQIWKNSTSALASRNYHFPSWWERETEERECAGHPCFCTHPSLDPPCRFPRAAFSSVYDKNVDDHIHSGPVPDDVIQATQSSKYWGPHPQTGVFGPPGEQATSAPVDASAASVLEEKAWFRPSSLEDLEKPHPHP